jgi:hypothetical protein
MILTAFKKTAEDLTKEMVEKGANVAIRRKGFVNISINPRLLFPQTLSIRKGMQQLTDTPEHHAIFPWTVGPEDAYGPGYVQETGLRVPDPTDTEQKFVFQYMPGMVLDRWKQYVPVREQYEDFFEALATLDAMAHTIARAVAESFDARNRRKENLLKYPGSLVERLKGGRCVTRVLRYCKKDDALPDAKVHLDRSMFTVHAWSSQSGLTLFGPDKQRIMVDETATDQVSVFTGEKFVAATRGHLGYGTAHGVRDKRRDLGKRTGDRYAIVLFVHPKTLESDAEWLVANKDVLKRHEQGFTL